MKKLFFLTMMLAMSQVSCDLLGIDSDSKCGDKQEGYYFRTSHGTGFFTDPTTQPGAGSWLDRSYIGGALGSRSTVMLEKWVQHVCPEKHVQFKCSVAANIEADFNVSAKSYWYFFYEEPLTLNISNDGVSRNWQGNGEFGLKQVYGDAGEGEFSVQATIDFPSQGSLAADSLYLFNNLQNVTLEAVYYDVKKQ